MHPTSMTAERRGLRGWAVALIVVASVLPLLPTLTYDFLRFDDPQFILREPFWQAPSLDAAADLFRRPVWGSYHPLHQFSYLVDRVLWGPTAAGVRVTQLFLYAISTWLVLVVGARLHLPAFGVALAGLLFAWHPAHVENVAWAAQRKDLLSASFTLAALAAYLGPDGEGPSRPARWALVVVCFGLGLLSKSVTVVLLPILVVLCVALGRTRRDLPWIAGMLLLGAAAARVHYLAQASFGAAIAGPESMYDRWRVSGRALAAYASQGALPIWPSPQSPPAPPRGPEDALAALVLVACAAAAAAWWRRGARRRAVFLVWFFAALLPTSGIVPLPTYMQDRYLLLPSVGLSLLAGDLFSALGARVRPARSSILAILGVALVGLAGVTSRYVWAWRDDVSLWSWAARIAPSDVGALARLASAHQELERWTEAELWARRALLLAPSHAEANLVLGRVLLRRGDAAAEEHLRRVAETGGVHGYTALLHLSLMASERGAFEEAQRWLDEAAAMAPRWAPDVLATRAHLRLQLGDPVGAAGLLQQAVTQAPGWSECWDRLATAERLAGARDRAVAASARGTAPARAALLGHMALDDGDVEGARRHLEEAATPASLEATLLRARLEVAGGDTRAARARLSGLRAREGGGGLRRAALEPDLRPLCEVP